MKQAVKTIGAVYGANGAIAQSLFNDLIGRWRSTHRIAGVLEEGYGEPDRMRGAGYLKSLTDDSRYPIFQGLGAGAKACQVDPAGATSACSAVQQDITAGCDLVVLSKFGRLESERRGLMPALLQALEQNVPVLIYVPGKFEDSWRQFAEPLFEQLPPEAQAIDTWWRATQPPM